MLNDLLMINAKSSMIYIPILQKAYNKSSVNMRVKTNQPSVEVFLAKTAQYKSLLDKRIESFCRELEQQTGEQFGHYPLEAIKLLTSYLRRGGKRIRGVLTMIGYELYDGQDQAMIIDAALAIEVIQAYILMMDDIQDRSETRRGGPTGHIMMRDYHDKHHLKDEAAHFGNSIAMCAFEVGSHLGLDIISGLNVAPELRLKALRNLHRCLIVTCHGQTLDIFNEVVEAVDRQAIDNVLTWKTSYYTFVNSLQLGAILAGAENGGLDTLYDYSIPAGRAFQITDDILGVFGDEFESGKSPMDDLREGKRTILVLETLDRAPKEDVYFVLQCLGKHDLTQAEFKHVKKIIQQCGALAASRQAAEQAVAAAQAALDTAASTWSQPPIDYLRGLATYLLTRKS